MIATLRVAMFLPFLLAAAFPLQAQSGGSPRDGGREAMPGTKDCSGGDDAQSDSGGGGGGSRTRNPDWVCPNGCSWGTCGHTGCRQKWLCTGTSGRTASTTSPPVVAPPAPSDRESAPDDGDNLLNELTGPVEDRSSAPEQPNVSPDEDPLEDPRLLAPYMLDPFWFPESAPPATTVDPSAYGPSTAVPAPPAALEVEDDRSLWQRMGDGVSDAADHAVDTGSGVLDAARDLADTAVERYDRLTDDVAVGFERTVEDGRRAKEKVKGFGRDAVERYDRLTDDVAVGFERTIEDGRRVAIFGRDLGYAVVTDPDIVPSADLIVGGTTFGLSGIGTWQAGTTVAGAGFFISAGATTGSGWFGYTLGKYLDKVSGASDFWSTQAEAVEWWLRRRPRRPFAEKIMEDFNRGGTGVEGLH